MSVEEVLKEINLSGLGDDRVKEVVGLSEAYLKDSRYYFSRGDYFTALSCIAYAEGLLDSLRILGHLNFRWSKPQVLRVMVGGTFDILHVGHVHYLREASRYGLVYAVIARDSTARRIKGRDPVNSELMRLEVIDSLKYVYRSMLGDESDILKPVEKIKPDIIVLGPDQPIEEDKLRTYLASRNLNTRVLRISEKYMEDVASTSKIINRILELYCRTL